MFYLPAMYYPINKEDRATGFLMPVYGTSTLPRLVVQQRLLLGDQPQPGHDAAPRLVHATGQGYGGEYRYVASAGSNGEFRIYRLSEKAATFHVRAVSDVTQPARESFEMRANVVQALPGRLQGARQRRLLQRRHGAAAVSDGPLQRHAAHPQLPGQRLGLARQRQQHQRHLRHQRGLLRRDRLADHRRPARASSSRGR